MKSIFLFTPFILMIVLSCSKDERDDLKFEDIKGIWYQEEYLQEFDRISRLEYNFQGNNTLEVLRKELSSDSRSILGYRFRTTGKYSVNENQISFYDLVSYVNNDELGSYTEIENLELIGHEINDYTVTCKIEDDGREIVFIYPPCGPAANCIGSITLQKE